MHHDPRQSGPAAASRTADADFIQALKTTEIPREIQGTLPELSALRRILGSVHRTSLENDRSLPRMIGEFLENATSALHAALDSFSKAAAPSEELIDAVDGALHNIKSASAAYCVIGDYDSALKIFDRLGGTVFEKMSGWNFEAIKAGVDANKEQLTAFFQRTAYDPAFMHLRAETVTAVLLAQERGEPPQFPREQFRQIIDKHLARAEVNERHRELLGEYFTDGFAIGMMDLKQRENRIKPNCFVQAVTSNINGYPSIQGLYAGLGKVPEVAGCPMDALGAVEFYGRHPRGKFVASHEIAKSKEVAEAVYEFSRAISTKAGELARDSGRKLLAEADVVKAYDLVERGGKPAIHESYRRIKETGRLMDLLASAEELSDEQFSLGMSIVASRGAKKTGKSK